MPRALSELYVPIESPASQSSTNSGTIVTFTPANNKRATGVYVSCETTACRVTFDGTAPGAATGPGIVIPAAAAPVFFPFPIGGPTSGAGPSMKAASNAGTASLISVIFVQ